MDTELQHIKNLLYQEGIAPKAVKLDPNSDMWIAVVPMSDSTEVFDMIRDTDELYPVKITRSGSNARIYFTDDPEQAAVATWDNLPETEQALLRGLYYNQRPVTNTMYQRLISMGLVELDMEGDIALTEAGRAIMEAVSFNR